MPKSRSCKPGKNKKFAKRVNGKCIRFGDPHMKIKKYIPQRRKSFCARHACHKKTDPATAGYQSCLKWNCKMSRRMSRSRKPKRKSGRRRRSRSSRRRRSRSSRRRRSRSSRRRRSRSSRRRSRSRNSERRRSRSSERRRSRSSRRRSRSSRRRSRR